MFNRNIESTYPWNLSIFRRVIAPRFTYCGCTDYSMISTATSLLHRRIPDDKTFLIKLREIRYDTALSNKPEAYWDLLYDIQKEYSMLIVQYKNFPSSEALEKTFNAIEGLLMQDDPAWTKPEMANKLMGDAGACRVFVNREKVTSVILTDTLDFRRWHYLESILAVCTPKLFADSQLEDDEKILLRTLTQRAYDGYLAALKKLEARYDIRSAMIDEKIAGFTFHETERRISIAKNEISSMERMIADYQREIRLRRSKIAAQNDIINGMLYQQNAENGDKELANFLKANACIDLIDVCEGTISFIVRTYYTNFSKSAYKTYRKEAFWECLRNERTPFDAIAVGKLCDALFIEECIKLKICSYIAITPRTADVHSIIGYGYPDTCIDYIPNRHHDGHDCFGDYEDMIEGDLSRGDIIAAVNDCMASARSVNIHESLVFDAFMQKAFGSSHKCFELPDGTSVTPVEALKWVEDREAQKKAEEEKAQEEAATEVSADDNTEGENEDA